MWRTRSSGSVHSFRPRRDRSARSANDALLLYGSPWRERSRLSRFGPSLLLFARSLSRSGRHPARQCRRYRALCASSMATRWRCRANGCAFWTSTRRSSRQTCRRSDGMVVPCGRLATAALAGLIGGQSVTCDLFERDRYGRWLGRCSVGGDDVANWLALHGLAIPYRSCACITVRGLSFTRIGTNGASGGRTFGHRGNGALQIDWRVRA